MKEEEEGGGRRRKEGGRGVEKRGGRARMEEEREKGRGNRQTYLDHHGSVKPRGPKLPS